MKRKKIINLCSILFVGIIPIVITSCSKITNNSTTPMPNPITPDDNKINLNDVTTINSESFKKLFINYPSIYQNDILNLSYLPNLKTIENNTFNKNTQLTSGQNFNISKIIFNDRLENIGDNAFKNIQSLKHLILPSSIKDIGNNSFDNAFIDGFSRVVFNETHKSINNIGNNAFLNNKNLNLFVIKNDELKSKIENEKQSIGYQNTILTDDLDSEGIINNLNISKFVPIISILELTNNTRLSSLTNEILNKKIKDNVEIQKNPIYKNTTFEIQEGSSEINGILKLKINIPTINFRNNENLIEISGFKNINNEYLTLESIKIDSYKYFENLQKETNISSWKTMEWKKYLSEIKVNTKDNQDSFNLAEESQSSNIDLEFIYNFKDNKHKLHLISKIKNHIYKNNSWIQNGETSQKEIKGKNLQPIDFELPNNKKDLFDFLSKQIKIKEEKRNELITNIYSSKYLSMFRSGIKTWPNTLIEIKNEYIDYSKELGLKKLNIESTNVYADDIGGILNFDFNMKDEEETINQYSYLGSYNIIGFKKINDLFNNNPNISINKNDKSPYKNFINSIKKIKTKEELTNLCNSKQTIEIKNVGINGYGNTVTNDINIKTTILDNFEKGEDLNSKQFETSANKYNFVNSIFKDKTLDSSKIDFKTNLFNNEFIINNLFFQTDINSSAKLIGINENSFNYVSDIEVIISLNNNSLNNENEYKYELKGKLNVIFQLSDFIN